MSYSLVKLVVDKITAQKIDNPLAKQSFPVINWNIDGGSQQAQLSFAGRLYKKFRLYRVKYPYWHKRKIIDSREKSIAPPYSLIINMKRDKKDENIFLRNNKTLTDI